MTASVLDRSAWIVVRYVSGDYLAAAAGEATVYADAYLRELEVSVAGPLNAAECRTLAARLVEAAAFAEGGPA